MTHALTRGCPPPLRPAAGLGRRMIWYLQHFFRPNEVEAPEFSLAIALGTDGARLSHNHARQYAYVLQSLTLWREIHNDMFKARPRPATARLCFRGRGPRSWCGAAILRQPPRVIM